MSQEGSQESKGRVSERAKRWLQGVALVALLIALLFLPAGRLDWWAAWALLIAYFGWVLLLSVWMQRRDPDLVAERTTPGDDNVEPWDRVIMGAYGVLLLGLFVVAGLDAGRFGWTSMPLFLRVLGWIGLFASAALVWWTMASNTYLSEWVRIQEERGHQVVSTGPYRYVRHPMYVGVMLAILCVPLVLGSWWALVLGAIIAILFVARTALEDRTLQEKLPGYREYAQQVRYRLLPGVW